MAKLWESPIYRLQTSEGRDIVIDVTSSASAGLVPNSVVTDVMVPFLRDRGGEGDPGLWCGRVEAYSSPAESWL